MDHSRLTCSRLSRSPVLLFTFIIALAGCEDGNNGSPDAVKMGEWEVIEITGEIVDGRHPPGEPLLCEPYTEHYQPVTGPDESFIIFDERNNSFPPSFYPDSVDGTKYEGDDLEVFVFHFGFENGYLGNDVLEGSGHIDFYESQIPGSWSFSGGFWNSDEVWGEFVAGTSSGGFSRFTVQGNFVSKDRIEGTWSWIEHTTWSALPATCDTYASGGGSWTAVRK